MFFLHFFDWDSWAKLAPFIPFYWYGFQENLLREGDTFCHGGWVSDMVRCEWVVCDVACVNLLVTSCFLHSGSFALFATVQKYADVS